MINKERVEKILKINGVSPQSSDEQIRSVLLSARFDNDEVDTAIMVLREHKDTKQTRVDGLHKVFRTNEGLAPQEITDLLGIEVDASTFYKPEPEEATALQGIQYLTVWLFSVFFAVVGILMYMFTNQVGPFHPSTQSQTATADFEYAE